MAKSVLIIEDDSATSEMLGYLAEMLNFDVVCSLEMLSVHDIKTLKPDLILLDHNVNGNSGGRLCLELKVGLSTKHIPVILISADNDLDQIADDSLADHFIGKPFDIKDLERSILKYIN